MDPSEKALTVSADALVIGAGVVGSSTAFELAKSGRKVIVLDRGNAVGCGTTSLSSAIVRFNYSTLDGVMLAWESSRHWNCWRDYLQLGNQAPAADYVKTGMIVLDAPPIPQERTCELYQQAGIEFERWTADDIRRNVPAMDPGRFWPPKTPDDPAFSADPDGVLGGVYVAEGGFIDDPLLATQNLADAARRRGSRYLFGQEVVGIGSAGDHVLRVQTSRGQAFEAPAVINAAGPWSGHINRLAAAGDDFSVTTRPLRVEVHQVPAPPGYNDGPRLGPVITDLDLGTYIRPARGDLMMIGGTEPDCDELEWIADPDSAHPNSTQAWYETQTLRAARRFPGLRIPSRPSGISGVYDVAADWTPIYDRTSLRGFYVAMGTSGNQFKNAPMIGQLMAAIIEATEAGHDHDASPITVTGPLTREPIGLAAFSRLRKPNPHSSGTVLG
jgi:sarcosine oxidase subunit beta